MLKQEFILLIPGIIYGVAIVDLLKLFRTRMYPELWGWGVFAFLSIIQSWLSLFNKLDKIATNNLDFLVIVIHSVMMAKAISLLTPEEEDIDSERYFLSIIKPFAKLVTAIILLNFIIQYTVYDDNTALWWRLTAIGWSLWLVFTQKRWVRYFILTIFLVFSLYRLLAEQINF